MLTPSQLTEPAVDYPASESTCGPSKVLRRCVIGGSLASFALVAFSVLRHPAHHGVEDWDYFFHLYEGARITILRYGQFPWWDPWNCGGVPLFANPQAGVFSLHMLLALVLGSVPGLKVSLLLHMAFGWEGARRLFTRYVGGAFAMIGASAFVWCGGLAMHAAAGHFSMTGIYFLPWIIYFALRLPEGLRWGAFLGLASGLMVCDAIHYQTVFAGLIGALTCLYAVWHSHWDPASSLWRTVEAFVVAAGVFLALAGFRLVLVLRFVADHSANADSAGFGMAGQNLAAVFVPYTDLQRPVPGLAGGWWEFGCYLGVITAVLVLLSLRRGPRFWHFAALLCLLSAQTAGLPWSPSYWLRRLPLLGGIRVLTRWRLPAALFLALCAAAGAQVCWHEFAARGRSARAALTGFFALGILEVGCFSALVLSHAFVPPVAIDLREEGAAGYHTVAHDWSHHANEVLLGATYANVGVVQGYEPLLGYDRDRPTAVKSPDEEGYIGYAVQGSEAVEPAYWSPNRIEFEGLRGPLRLNQAAGSYWMANGGRIWPDARTVELETPFQVNAGEDGRLLLKALPPGWVQGLGVTVLGVFACCVMVCRACVCSTGERAGVCAEHTVAEERVAL